MMKPGFYTATSCVTVAHNAHQSLREALGNSRLYSFIPCILPHNDRVLVVRSLRSSIVGLFEFEFSSSLGDDDVE